jgi:hypothetical protein
VGFRRSGPEADFHEKIIIHHQTLHPHEVSLAKNAKKRFIFH